MSIPSALACRAETESEFMMSAGSAVKVIAEILNEDINGDEEPKMNDRLRGGLFDALEIIGTEMLARSQDLTDLLRKLEKESRS